MEWEKQTIFTATIDDPNHSYDFQSQAFNEVTSDGSGFSLMGITKVQTFLDNKANLVIFAYINEQIVAKDFLFFDIHGKASKVHFRQSFFDGEPMPHFSFEFEYEK